MSPDEKSTIWHRLYHGETSFDFVGRKSRWFLLSGIVIVVGLASLFTSGLNLGIDFKGGTSWEVPARGASVAKTRDAMRVHGLSDAKIQVITPSGATKRVRVESDIKCSEAGSKHPELQTQCDDIKASLAKLGNTKVDNVDVNAVGPSWGRQITHKAERALVFFFILITLYISFRFEWKMAVAAIIAVVHDILVTAGVYSLTGFTVTPGTVVAFLTILGYSLYDTIVVFDKVEENTRGLAASGRMTYGDTVNLSMNQVLMRSLNTSLVAILPVLSVLIVGAYILGATALEDFALALVIGLLTGAYSSIFVASPLLAILKEREPRYATIRQRVLAKGGSAPLTPAAAAAASGGISPAAGSPSARVGTQADAVLRPGSPPRPASGARPGGTRPPPRPRKKGKRR